MKILCATAMSASLMAMVAGVTPAQAQAGGGNGRDAPHLNMLADTPSKTQEEVDAERARDKAYKDSLRTIPDAKVANDPWGAVRSNDAPKSAPAKAAAKAKPKTVTRTGANTPN